MSDTENLAQQSQPPKKNPYTLWFVVAAFVLPVAAAYLMFFSGFTPSAFTNKGELIQPVIDIEALAIVDDSNVSVERDDVTKRKWNMVYFAGASCDQACNDSLLKIRQVNIAVGKNAYRLRHMIVHLEPPDETFQALIKSDYPDARRLYADRQKIRAVLQPISGGSDANTVYLMDPIGNIMMRFTEEMPGKWLIHDLNKLFKVSQIG
jgi:cytochrome oxidase Cu insertion factor (SCO1/SenC/PrrC family)